MGNQDKRFWVQGTDFVCIAAGYSGLVEKLAPDSTGRGQKESLGARRHGAQELMRRGYGSIAIWPAVSALPVHTELSNTTRSFRL